MMSSEEREGGRWNDVNLRIMGWQMGRVVSRKNAAIGNSASRA